MQSGNRPSQRRMHLQEAVMLCSHSTVALFMSPRLGKLVFGDLIPLNVRILLCPERLVCGHERVSLVLVAAVVKESQRGEVTIRTLQSASISGFPEPSNLTVGGRSSLAKKVGTKVFHI